jgi:hypothetical protein
VRSRDRTGDNDLEGRCVTATPYARGSATGSLLRTSAPERAVCYFTPLQKWFLRGSNPIHEYFKLVCFQLHLRTIRTHGTRSRVLLPVRLPRNLTGAEEHAFTHVCAHDHRLKGNPIRRFSTPYLMPAGCQPTPVEVVCPPRELP